MTNLEIRLNKFLGSVDFKQRVHAELVSNPKFGLNGNGNGSGGTKVMAESAAIEMISILKQSIVDNVQSERARDRFLNSIKSNVHFIQGLGWAVDVFFDEDEVSSNSLYYEKYEMGAYLPVLFNNGYKASKTLYGYDNYGDWIRSKRSRSETNFIQLAADRFNAIHNKDIMKVEYNEVYNGGTLPRGNLASGVFQQRN